ncbi:MAG: GTP pyrophosphokinase family protein [Eubacterium sp.]|nr:GTP pyrophosphokinase family protein [Eubacterium sp.]
MTSEEKVYGPYTQALEKVREDIVGRINACCEKEKLNTGNKVVEHIESRIKDPESMAEKCRRKGLEETPKNALREIRDSVGVRIVCDFIDDIYLNVDYIREFQGCRVVEEKDYIRGAKPNGYRSYHMILELIEPFEDVDGNMPGRWFVEVQLRTIAMDTWAALEHEMKYKTEVKNQNLIESELKRCADELASCDVSLQTIRNLIREGN